MSPDNLFFVTAEMTLANLVRHLAGFRPLAASSLATARTEATALATDAIGVAHS
ncbi:hypothetical protein [Sphaerisporangium fuscum]|uniref:hypothetical protein n=1 Tax=Sphaerisporangium fuscum TaxID=2835868 RepID=UPI001BDCE0A5|nr:hypothetical protein [Sphaerisporangium fuscum]